jgi:hypothetical protein
MGVNPIFSQSSLQRGNRCTELSSTVLTELQATPLCRHFRCYKTLTLASRCMWLHQFLLCLQVQKVEEPTQPAAVTGSRQPPHAAAVNTACAASTHTPPAPQPCHRQKPEYIMALNVPMATASEALSW